MNQTFLDAELAEIKSVINAAAKMTDSRVGAVLGDLVAAGGKFLRPQILLLSAMTGKYDAERIRPLAAAVELLHTATLLHDDVIDDSPFRRGIPSAHTRIGRKDAVLAGDFLFSRCFMLAAQSSGPDTARGLAKAIDIIVSAELAQDSDRWHFSPSVRTCIRKIGGKTAVLFGLAARAGSTEAKAPARTVSALSRAAWAAGIAFQIQDDILDWEGDEKQLGKAVLNDLAEGFCTLPLAYALASDPQRLRGLLTPEAVGAGSSVEVALAVRETGALARAAEQAHAYRDRSLASLDGIPASFARDRLARIFTSFVNRER